MTNINNMEDVRTDYNHDQDKDNLKLILIDLNNILSWQNSSLIFTKITLKTFDQSSKSINQLNLDLKSIDFNTIVDVENHLSNVKTYLINFDLWLSQNLVSIENFSKDIFFNSKYIDYTFDNLIKIKGRLNNVISISKNNLTSYKEAIAQLKITFINQAMIEKYKTQFVVILYKNIVTMNEARVIWYNSKNLVEKKSSIITEIESNKLINHYNISAWLADLIEKLAINNQINTEESNLTIKLQSLNLPDSIN
jgi:hypothetical protein